MFTFTTQNKYDEIPAFGSKLQPGFYNAQIVKVDACTSQNGNEQLKLTVEVTDRDVFIQVTEYLTLTQKSVWKLERWLAACGYEFRKGEQIVINPATFLGRRLVVLTYMTPGKELNNDGSEKLFVSILRVMRPQDCPALGELEPQEYQRYGLAPDGTDLHRARPQTPMSKRAPNIQQNKWSGRPADYNYPEEDDLGF